LIFVSLLRSNPTIGISADNPSTVATLATVSNQKNHRLPGYQVMIDQPVGIRQKAAPFLRGRATEFLRERQWGRIDMFDISRFRFERNWRRLGSSAIAAPNRLTAGAAA
jgi:hypothetical protein